MGAREYRYDTEVVRLMYDHASSVVWFPDPVRYEQSGQRFDPPEPERE